MATWAKEIMVLANDFCLNTKVARQIISDVDTMPIPQGKSEEVYKYDRAYSRIKQMIINT